MTKYRPFRHLRENKLHSKVPCSGLGTSESDTVPQGRTVRLSDRQTHGNVCPPLKSKLLPDTAGPIQPKCSSISSHCPVGSQSIYLEREQLVRKKWSAFDDLPKMKRRISHLRKLDHLGPHQGPTSHEGRCTSTCQGQRRGTHGCPDVSKQNEAKANARPIDIGSTQHVRK